MKRKLISMIFTLAFTLQLMGCNNSYRDVTYKDGVYIGKSSEDDLGAYGEVKITIEEGSIAECEYVTWQKDGSIKDENYGKVNGEISNQDYYDKAQLAVKAMTQYAEKLVEAQSLKGVDAISGATISYSQFVEAVNNALDQAQE